MKQWRAAQDKFPSGDNKVDFTLLCFIKCVDIVHTCPHSVSVSGADIQVAVCPLVPFAAADHRTRVLWETRALSGSRWWCHHYSLTRTNNNIIMTSSAQYYDIAPLKYRPTSLPHSMQRDRPMACSHTWTDCQPASDGRGLTGESGAWSYRGEWGVVL